MTRALILSLALAQSACAGDLVETREELSVETGGLATGVAFLPGSPDVAVASAPRGQVDVFERVGGGYRAFGSFFAGGTPVALGTAAIAGRPSLVTRTDEDRLFLLVGSGEPHRLSFPIRVATEPRLADFAAGDLNGDGTDEIVIAGEGVYRFGELERAVDAKPESPPSPRREAIDPEVAASAVAIADADGSGLGDVLVAVAGESVAQLYLDPGAADATAPAVAIALPDVAVALASVGCADAPFVALLADGRVVGVTRDGRVVDRSAGPVERTAAGDARIALVPGARDEVLLADACLEDAVATDLAGADTGALALSPEAGLGRRLARLDRDGARLSVHRIVE